MKNEIINSIFYDSLSIFYAIIVEAVPFVVLGVLVSALISIFVKDEHLIKLIPKNKILGHFVVGAMGFLFPVCECGNLPVVRKLILKGLPVTQGLTFLLAAPVVNPIVILTTLVAFRFAPEVVFIRVFSSYLIAISVGLIMSLHSDHKKLLNDKFLNFCEDNHEVTRKSLSNFFRIVAREFMNVMWALIFGSMIASIISTISREYFTSIANSPSLSIIAMMALAAVMTICSTVDAFVALGYVNTFPLSSILAFMVYGPMIDIRSLSLMLTTFSLRLVILTVLMVSQFVFIFSAFYSLFSS